MTSDIIPQLSYIIPLLVGGIYTSSKIIAGQFSSLNLSFSSDRDTSVDVQYSNDGTNFDINIIKNFTGNLNAYESIVILGKWIRLVVSNTSGVNQTHLRIYVYASVNNTNVNALISKIGNISPEINILNFPLTQIGDLATQAFSPTAINIIPFIRSCSTERLSS